MTWLGQLGPGTAGLTEARRLMADSRSAEACRILDRILREASDSRVRADALLQRLSALINLGRTAEYTPAVEQAFDAARELNEPYLLGHLHAIAAVAAHDHRALDRCVTHLVQSVRALGAVKEPDSDAAWAWHDLAMAYSYLGFHGYALSTIERARQLGLAAGIPEGTFAAPGIRLRNAVALDHDGDSDGCLRVLRDIAADLHRFRATGTADRLRPSSLAAYGYAAARRTALGGPDDQVGGADAIRLLIRGGDSARSRDLRRLGEVCLAIAGGRTEEATALLDNATVAADTLGAPEPARLRSLCLSRAGDHAAAHRADRYAFRLASRRDDRLRDVYVDGIAARLDHEAMRRELARYDGEALTDPLTGLLNRRHLERHAAALISRGEGIAVGMCDLAGFDAVNSRHGRHSGDLVLQRVAGVVNRVMRRGDLVARYGGDEFVVVLPGSGSTEAAEVARRISVAVAAEDWESLVPGTPVTVNVGFAEVPAGAAGGRDPLATALAEADRARGHRASRA